MFRPTGTSGHVDTRAQGTGKICSRSIPSADLLIITHRTIPGYPTRFPRLQCSGRPTTSVKCFLTGRINSTATLPHGSHLCHRTENNLHSNSPSPGVWACECVCPFVVYLLLAFINYRSLRAAALTHPAKNKNIHTQPATAKHRNT